MSERPVPYIVGNVYHLDFSRGHFILRPEKVAYNKELPLPENVVPIRKNGDRNPDEDLFR